jgi:SAM-dependent methyltransferase
LEKQNEIVAYRAFVDDLCLLLNQPTTISPADWEQQALKCVNGLASAQLRKLVSLEVRRKNGTFFTDSSLAKELLAYFKPKLLPDSYVYDPACGAGNLLIAMQELIYHQFPDSHQIILAGSDIHPEFVDASRLRLQLNALLWQRIENAPASFSILQADGYQFNSQYEKATHIMVNPPFNLIEPDNAVPWSSGKVSAAALFIDKIIQHVRPGVPVYAILPDVLRSGSRYQKWRDVIRSQCSVEKVKLLGQFDKYTDVDVFSVCYTKRKTQFALVRTCAPEKKERTISDLFTICVGPVVDNRDEHNGPLLPYVVSRGLEGWTKVKKVGRKRRHTGKSFPGPFVVIKRTSRLGDKHRAIATIINIKSLVFVDNHLIVLQPKSGRLRDCKEILRILKDARTDQWINEQIRCRHLTVRVVSNIPICQ